MRSEIRGFWQSCAYTLLHNICLRVKHGKPKAIVILLCTDHTSGWASNYRRKIDTGRNFFDLIPILTGVEYCASIEKSFTVSKEDNLTKRKADVLGISLAVWLFLKGENIQFLSNQGTDISYIFSTLNRAFTNHNHFKSFSYTFIRFIYRRW